MGRKSNFSVVRNAGKMATQFEACERHNERQNVDYKNADIIKERAEKNIQFRRVFSAEGVPETYEETYNRLLAEGKIVKKGLKADAKVFGELVFDINTDFFEENGGYDFAGKFYEEVYQYAIKEVGNEDYILSAVMHADERNKEASERLGYDVYHYHLHVIYIPVVEKEVYYQKTNKDPALAGKLKEVIPQISHSKKWPIRVPVERDGKSIILNEYSLLQDRFFEHMQSAGFEGFERGERGSTAEHLSVLEYKSKQEKEHLTTLSELAKDKEQESAALSALIEQREKQITVLDKKAAQQKKQIATLDKKLVNRSSAVENFGVIKEIGAKKNLMGQIVLSESELDFVKDFAREGVVSRSTIADLERRLATARKDRDFWKQKYEKLWEQVRDFVSAVKRAPQRLLATIADIFKQPPEISDSKKQELEHIVMSQQGKKKSYRTEI